MSSLLSFMDDGLMLACVVVCSLIREILPKQDDAVALDENRTRLLLAADRCVSRDFRHYNMVFSLPRALTLLAESCHINLP